MGIRSKTVFRLLEPDKLTAIRNAQLRMFQREDFEIVAGVSRISETFKIQQFEMYQKDILNPILRHLEEREPMPCEADSISLYIHGDSLMEHRPNEANPVFLTMSQYLMRVDAKIERSDGDSLQVWKASLDSQAVSEEKPFHPVFFIRDAEGSLWRASAFRVVLPYVVQQDPFDIEKTLRSVRAAFDKAMKWTSERPEEDLKIAMGLIRYQFAHAMPFKRGSAAIAEWLETAIYRYHGFDRFQQPCDRLLDLDAFTAFSLKEFMENYLALDIGQKSKPQSRGNYL